MKKTSFTPFIIFLFILVSGTFVLVNWGYFYSSSKKQQITQSNNPYKLSLKKAQGLKKKIFHYIPSQFSPSRNIDLQKNLTIIKRQLAKGNIAEAQNNLRTLLLFYPDNKTVLSLLGGVYYLSGEYNNAKRIFNKMIKLYPESILARENIGLIYEKEKQYDKAIAEFIKVITISKGSVIAYLHLAGIYSVLGENDKAIHYFKLAHSLIGDKIKYLSYDPAYNNIRNMPDFILIMENSRKTIQSDSKKY